MLYSQCYSYPFPFQSSLAIELLIRVAVKADLSKPDLATLALNLWNLAQKHGCLDVKLAVSVSPSIPKHVLAFSCINFYISHITGSDHRVLEEEVFRL